MLKIKVEGQEYFLSKDQHKLHFHIRKLYQQNSKTILGNYSHRETPYFNEAPDEKKFEYLSFSTINENGKYGFSRIGYILVHETEEQVFLNELDILKDLVEYPEGLRVFYSLDDIQQYIFEKTGRDLSAENNDLFTRY
jgi:hypothetical protein